MKKYALLIISLSLVVLISLINSYAAKTKKYLPKNKYKLVCTDSITLDYPKGYLAQGITASYLTKVINGYIWKDAGMGSYHQFDVTGKLIHSYIGQYKICPDDNAKSYKKTPLRVGSIIIGNKHVYVYDDLTQYWFVHDMQGNFIKRLNRMGHYKYSAILGSGNILSSNDTLIFIPLTYFDTIARFNNPIVHMINLYTGKTLKKFLEPDSMLLKYKSRITFHPSALVPIEIDFSKKELYTAYNHSYFIHKYNYASGQNIMVFGQPPPGYQISILPDMDYKVITASVRDTIDKYSQRNWKYSSVICHNPKNNIVARTIYPPSHKTKQTNSLLQVYNSNSGELITQIQLPDNYYNLCHITDDLEFWIENRKSTRNDLYIIYKVKLIPDN